MNTFKIKVLKKKLEIIFHNVAPLEIIEKPYFYNALKIQRFREIYIILILTHTKNEKSQNTRQLVYLVIFCC